MTPHDGGHRLLRGRLHFVGSAVCFALMGLAVRKVPDGWGSADKVFYRGAIGLLVLASVLKLTGTMPPRPTDIAGLVRRGVLGAAALLLYFFAVDTVGLTKATLYCYTYPLFSALFAWAELGERPSPRAAIAVVLAVAGVAMTIDPAGWTGGFAAGDTAGISAGILTGAAMASVRKLRRTESSAWIVLFFMAISALMAAPFMVWNLRVPDAHAAVPLAAIGLFALAAQMLMTRGYRFVAAAEGSVMSLLVVPLSAALAFTVLNERQPLRFWIGAAVVVGATAGALDLPAVRRRRRE